MFLEQKSLLLALDGERFSCPPGFCGQRAPTPKGSHRTWTTPGSWQCNQDDQGSLAMEPQVTELLLNAHTYWGHDPSLGDGDLGLSLDHYQHLK